MSLLCFLKLVGARVGRIVDLLYRYCQWTPITLRPRNFIRRRDPLREPFPDKIFDKD